MISSSCQECPYTETGSCWRTIKSGKVISGHSLNSPWTPTCSCNKGCSQIICFLKDLGNKYACSRPDFGIGRQFNFVFFGLIVFEQGWMIDAKCFLQGKLSSVQMPQSNQAADGSPTLELAAKWQNGGISQSCQSMSVVKAKRFHLLDICLPNLFFVAGRHLDTGSRLTWELGWGTWLWMIATSRLDLNWAFANCLVWVR